MSSEKRGEINNNIHVTCQKLSKWYSKRLFEVVGFWERNSLDDSKYGGYFTCLDASGKVFVWLQARQVWMFSKLYNSEPLDEGYVTEERKQNWLKIAESGALFLEKYGHDKEGNFYFSLTQDGKPIIEPYNIFSDCFVAMAFSQFFRASKLDWAKDRALKSFENIEKRKANPKGKWAKGHKGTRDCLSLAIYMIDLNLCLEMKEVLPDLDIEARVEKNLEIIFSKFLHREKLLFLENVCENQMDHFETRLINPGHILECCWFILDVLAQQKNCVKKEARRALTLRVILSTLEFGWDVEKRGIFYFMDILGKPVQQLEWDQKLWWVHQESMIACLKAYEQSGQKVYFEWFIKIHDYFVEKFSTKDEFWGYLNRDGEVLLKLKGGKWKGCFHSPRCCRILKGLLDTLSK